MPVNATNMHMSDNKFPDAANNKFRNREMTDKLDSDIILILLCDCIRFFFCLFAALVYEVDHAVRERLVRRSQMKPNGMPSRTAMLHRLFVW